MTAPPTPTNLWCALSGAAFPPAQDAAGQLMAWPRTESRRATPVPTALSGAGLAMPCRQWPADPVLALGSQAWRVANVISWQVQQLALAPVNLTWFEFQVLRYTCEHTVATTFSASTQFGVDAAEVLIASSQLHRRGLLYLSTARAEGGTVVAATERGHDIVDTVQQAVAVEECRLLRPWRPSDLWLILAVLNKTAAYSDATQPDPPPAIGGIAGRCPVTHARGRRAKASHGPPEQ